MCTEKRSACENREAAALFRDSNRRACVYRGCGMIKKRSDAGVGAGGNILFFGAGGVFFRG